MQYPNIAQPQYGFAPTMPMMPSMSDMPPAMMAKGGLASAAQDVQAQGRNGDSMLVHMTPGEVGGLQALAMQQGGSLTINPQTGLPEANFLKNLLPTLLGVGLSFIPGVGPLAAGMITGGIETVRTGDIGKGFLAGLGAYGGANLAGSLGAAGAAGASGAQGASAMLGVPEAVGGAASTAGSQASMLAAENAAMGLTPAQSLANIGSSAGYAANAAVPSVAQTAATQAGQGFQNLFASGQTGEAARTAFMGNAGGMGGLATNVGMAAAPEIGSMLTPQPYGAAPEAKEESTYTGPYTPTERRVSYPTDDERRRRSSEFTYFTPSNPVPFERGGSVPMLENGGFVLTKKAVDGLGGGSNKKGQQVASRGLGAIPIKGPGTGTSDSIKTSIDRKRPALVSNGEAYVPKKQVAKHGGAKKFYALMKKAERRA